MGGFVDDMKYRLVVYVEYVGVHSVIEFFVIPEGDLEPAGLLGIGLAGAACAFDLRKCAAGVSVDVIDFRPLEDLRQLVGGRVSESSMKALGFDFSEHTRHVWFPENERVSVSADDYRLLAECWVNEHVMQVVEVQT